jgi:hypothetical protein
VLAHLVRAGPVPVQFAPAGPFFGDFAQALSLPARDGRAGRVGLFAWAEAVPWHLPQLVPGHFAQPVLEHLERAVRVRPVPAHLSGHQMVAQYFPFDSD